MEIPTVYPPPQPDGVRKRGAPKGNRNAVTHGYYSKGKQAELNTELAKLPPLAQLDAQIEIYSARARVILLSDPVNARVLRAVANRIARLKRDRAIAERLQRDPGFRRQVSDAFLQDGIVVDLSLFTKHASSAPENPYVKSANDTPARHPATPVSSPSMARTERS